MSWEEKALYTNKLIIIVVIFKAPWANKKRRQTNKLIIIVIIKYGQRLSFFSLGKNDQQERYWTEKDLKTSRILKKKNLLFQI